MALGPKVMEGARIHGVTPVTWDPGVPPEVRAAVGDLLDRWLPLAPTWLQEFSVHFNPEMDARAAVTLNHRNRQATLRLTGHWFSDTPEERANSLRHEILHISLAPIRDAFSRIAEHELGEEGLASAVFEDAMEASVEDLARGIGRVAI